MQLEINLNNLAGTALSFAPGQSIYRKGEPAASLYRIVKGVVRTCRYLADGRRQIGAFYFAGDTFGFEPSEQHAFSAEAISETHIIMAKRTAMASFQLSHLARHELGLAQKHLFLLVQTAPERLASFLFEIAERLQCCEEVELLMTRRDIADYLGLTFETVSRTLSQLEKQSVIARLGDSRIVLSNPMALRELAEA